MQREYERYGFFRFTNAGEDSQRELKSLKIGENINTICRVLEKFKRRARVKTKEGAEKVIFEGKIADYTAKFPILSFEKREEIEKDKVLRIENAYVRRWKGMPALYIGRNTKIREISVDFPSYSELIKPKKSTILEIISSEGALDVIVEADVVSVSGEDKRGRVGIDDGTGAMFLLVKEKEKEIMQHFRIGMSTRIRGNVVEDKSDGNYVMIAKEFRMLGEEYIWEEIKNFLSRYT